jgi:iron complex outermembrane recepter protein
MLRVGKRLISGLPGLLIISGVAHAQAPAGNAATATEESAKSVLEEVLVTSRKREESVLDVPTSITALSAADIAASGISNIRDLNAFAPGLNFQSQVGNGAGGRNSGAIIFRGMSPVQGLAREQSGAVFVDGIYVASGVQSVDTADVERIEVLRGPQNAYFGRNTFGGAINFISRTPGDVLKGSVTAGTSERGGYEFRGDVEGPLVDGKLSGRLSAASYRNGWQYRATDGGELGGEQTRSVTGTLYATPLEGWNIKVRGHLQRDDDGPMTNTYIRGTQYGSLCPGQTFSGTNAAGSPVSFALSRPYFCGSIPSLSQLGTGFVTMNTNLFPTVLNTIGNPNLLSDIATRNTLNSLVLARAPTLGEAGMRRDITRFSLQTDYTFAHDITLAANVGYEQSYGNTVYDADRADAQNSYAVLPQISRTQSYELRLQSGQEQRFRWLVGYSFLQIQAEAQQLGYQIQVAQGGATPTGGFLNARADDRSETPAVFGAVEFDLLQNLTLGGEVRRQTDKSSLLNTNLTRTKFEFTDTLPRVFVRWQPIDDLNVYVTWGRGVMPGQLNGQFVTATAQQQAEICAVVPSCGPGAPLPKVTNKEIGVKQRLLNGRLQYSISLYDMDWKNINSNQSVTVSTSPFLLSVVAPNDARLKGIEFEGRWLVTPEWDVGVNFNVQDNKYTKFIGGTLSTLTSGVIWFNGNDVPKQPNRTAMLSSGYRAQLNDTWGWYARGEAAYTGRMWDSEANIVQSDPFTRVNARFGIERGDLGVELYVRNLLDDQHWTYIARSTSLAEPGALLQVRYPTPTSGLTTVQGLLLGAPEPRTIGLRVHYKF